ncbi:hypothetical protein H4R20_005291, partial [Coemansia guatemalensis]
SEGADCNGSSEGADCNGSSESADCNNGEFPTGAGKRRTTRGTRGGRGRGKKHCNSADGGSATANSESSCSEDKNAFKRRTTRGSKGSRKRGKTQHNTANSSK